VRTTDIAPDVCPVSHTPWLHSILPSEFDVDLVTGVLIEIITMRYRRLALIFYCLGSLDLLDSLEKVTRESERESWRNDIWGLHAGAPVLSSPFLYPKLRPRRDLGERLQAQLVYDWLGHRR